MFTSKEQVTPGLHLVEGQPVMSCNTQHNPSTEGYLAENVRGAEAEKSCVRRISSCAISLTKSFKLFFSPAKYCNRSIQHFSLIFNLTNVNNVVRQDIGKSTYKLYSRGNFPFNTPLFLSRRYTLSVKC